MTTEWQNTSHIQNIGYQCAHCDHQVAPNLGYTGILQMPPRNAYEFIYICPKCSRPTYFSYTGSQVPSPLMGREITGISDSLVADAYNEARACASVGAFTACALMSRKLLMSLSHSFGAPEGQTFVQYLDYLETNHYLPPNSKPWIDKIRTKGNEATHQILAITRQDATAVLALVEMLLQFNFEGPSIGAQLT